jgi:hypothetical protein
MNYGIAQREQGYQIKDVSGMPSRDVGGCGTMWILDQIGKRFHP